MGSGNVIIRNPMLFLAGVSSVMVCLFIACVLCIYFPLFNQKMHKTPYNIFFNDKVRQDSTTKLTRTIIKADSLKSTFRLRAEKSN